MSDFLQIAYTSRMSGKVKLADLSVMAAQASANNSKRGVSGTLLFSARHFAQVIEGPASAVVALWDLMQTDSRHSDIRLRVQRVVKGRQYPGWAMLFGVGDEEFRTGADASDQAWFDREDLTMADLDVRFAAARALRGPVHGLAQLPADFGGFRASKNHSVGFSHAV